MSTPSFGQPSPFGAATPPPPPPADEPVPGKGNKTVVIAVAAGVVALGVLGGAAALVLGAGDEAGADSALPPAAVSTVEPSVAPSTPAAPLPTAAVQGRNVFVPLVEASDAASAGAVVDPVAAAPSPSATAAPTAAPVAAPAPLPAPAVTRTVSVPGPVVTESVPGPTVTATTPGPVRDNFAYDVTVVAVEDPDPELEGDSTATFLINGVEVDVLEGDRFLDFFEYYAYKPGTPAGEDPVAEPEVPATVTFAFGSTLWSVSTGTHYGLGPLPAR